MSAELGVERLIKDFGNGYKAVDDVSFTVAAGEIVVLLGPSGCGKTTTLRCVAGLEHPTGGAIRLGGEVVSAPERGIAMPPRQRNVGMVFQSYAVWPHMTVRQNVAYPLKTRKMTRAEQDRRVSEALALVDLSDYASRPVVSLSGGQMQRVALARSMVYEPRLLLLDEPLSNLDAQLRLRLRDDLRRIIKQVGLTALYVTHDQNEAVVLGDRIGVMQSGHLLQLAPPQELYNRPAELFVASFTGASNVFDGKVRTCDGEYGIIDVGADQAMTAWMPSRLGVGTPVRVAARPENVRFDGSDAEMNRFPAVVTAQRYQGTQTVYDLELFGVRIEVLEVGSAPRDLIGQTVGVTLPPATSWAYAAT